MNVMYVDSIETINCINSINGINSVSYHVLNKKASTAVYRGF